jgi:hypothetical protein
LKRGIAWHKRIETKTAPQNGAKVKFDPLTYSHMLASLAPKNFNGPMTETDSSAENELPKGVPGGRAIRAVLNAAGGAIPFVGGILASAAGAWSEQEQAKVNSFFEHWLKMLQAEMSEKAQTILEIMARLDMKNEKTAERVASPEYQSLLRKAGIGPELRAKRSVDV